MATMKLLALRRSLAQSAVRIGWSAARIAAANLTFLGVAALLIAAEPSNLSIATNEPRGASLSVQTNLQSALQERRRQQFAAAKTLPVFHDFSFAEKYASSGIRFQHRVVEDAGKNYKPVHYDHGNGIAVADVDGDGLLDIYFTTQLGTNQLWRNLGGGKFEDITDRAGVGLPDQIAVTASFADVDNDGHPDLFVTTVRHGNHL